MNPQQALAKRIKQQIYEADPGKAAHTEMMVHTDELETANESLASIDKKLGGPLPVQIEGAEIITIQGKPGKDGETPTDEELLGLIKPLIPKVKDGHTPTKDELEEIIIPLIPIVKDGETPTDEKLKSLIKPLIPKPIKGNDGYTPKKGVDYFDGKDANSPELQVLVKAVVDELKRSRSLDISHLRNSEQVTSAIGKLKKLDMNDLRWHGGGKLAIEFNGTVVTEHAKRINYTGSGVSSVTADSNGEVTVNITGGGGTGSSYIVDQTPDNGTYNLLVGSVDGVNATFTVSQGAYTSGTLIVWVNGKLQTQGSSNEFTETSAAAGTFTFTSGSIPFTDDVITVQYLTTSTTTASLATESISANGVTTVFNVSNTPIYIYADGVGMTNGNGYTLSGLQVTFDNAPSQAWSVYNSGGTVIAVESIAADGVTTVFNLTNTPKYIQADTQGMIDTKGYALSGNQVTFDNAPTKAFAIYNAGTHTVATETVAADGVTTVFTLTHTPLFGMGDGSAMRNGQGYTLSGLQVTFDNPPTQAWFVYNV